jgi:regulatory protein
VTAKSLDNAAVFYLSRFASSSGNLRRVLMRKVARGGGDAAEGAALVDALIARYFASGLLNDRAYAEQAAASLARRGGSRYTIAGKLAQKGVPTDLVKEAMAALADNGGGELASVCALIRRRRLGPYRLPERREEYRQKDLATLARAGFGIDMARRALQVSDVDALDALARGDEDAD